MLIALALLACTSQDTTTVPPPDGPGPVTEAPPPPPARVPAILLADASPVAAPTAALETKDCFYKPPPKPKPTPPQYNRTVARPTSAPAATGTKSASRPTKAPDDLAMAPSAPPAMATAEPAAEMVRAPSRADAADPAPRGTAGVAGGAAATGAAPMTATASTTPMPTDSGAAKPVEKKAAPEEADQASMRDKPKDGDAVKSSFDWGGTTWLSNDDSMSLASAQHVLHAVKNGDDIHAADVRPHELLNYFSFDTEPPGEGSLFSVVPSAEKTADETLTLAFAVKGALPPRRPMDLTFVIDRSGSMEQEGRMEYVRRALLLGVDQLAPGDRVDIVLFDDKVCTPIKNFVVGRDSMDTLKGTIGKLEPEGGTNIGKGLNEAYKLIEEPDRDQGIHRNRRVMLMTDALTNQGEIDPDALAKVSAAYDKAGVRLTGVGVGVGFNDRILDTVTEKGHGAYVYLGSEAVVDRLFGPGFRSMTETIAHDVQFELDLPPTLAMERFYGEESSTDKADIDPIHYYANTSQLFLQDLKVDPRKLAPADPITMTIHYRDAFTDEPGEQKFTWTVGDLMKSDRHNLDKARALMSWTDVLLASAMGGDACGAPLTTWSQRAGKVSDDAEIAYVHGLVGKTCKGVMPLPDVPTGSLAGVAYKVRVDSDVPIAEVELACGPKNLKESLTGGDTIAKFSAPPGACTVTLQGNVPMTAKVDVPDAGGDVKCMVRGGRMSCG